MHVHACVRECMCVCGERGQYKRDKGKAEDREMSWPQEMLWFGVGLCTSVASVPFISDLKIKDKSSKVWQSSKEIPT